MVAFQSGDTVTIGNVDLNTPNRSTFGDVIPVADPGRPLSSVFGGLMDPQTIWRTQPSVRKVVSFIARNVASVSAKAYIRNSDIDRQRDSSSPAELRLLNPQRFMTRYQLMRNITTDLCMYDTWAIVLDGDRLRRIPPRMLVVESNALGEVYRLGVQSPDGVIDITDAPVAFGSGWSAFAATGTSPLITLQAILAEQANAVKWRDSLWRNGPKLSGYLKMSGGFKDPETRDRFLQSWRKWRDTEAGGTPILEDGMEYETLDSVKPSDAKDIEGRVLTDVEVSSAYHIAPELVGARQGTFSNVEAFRQMLYGPALGPIFEEIQQAINAGIVPSLDTRPGVYIEFDRAGAQTGGVLEEAERMSKAAGGPFMTRNEVRASRNLPPIAGADELVTPMNVTAGGLASPHDTAPKSEHLAIEPANSRFRRLTAKAATPEAKRDAAAAKLAAVYEQQAAAVTAPVTDVDAFHEKWDGVVFAAIHDEMWASAVAGAESVKPAKQKAAGFDVEVMRNYVKKMAEGTAESINAGVLAALDDVDFDFDPDDEADEDGAAAPAAGKRSLREAFEILAASTAVAWGAAILADAYGFGSHDAAKSLGSREKTWHVASPNPRASHAAMDGETVPIEEPFSNGLMWPGSYGDVEEVAGCTCEVSFTF